MVATNSTQNKSIASRKERSNEVRSHAPERPKARPEDPIRIHEATPAAGAHAASHLVNHDATPGAGVLPSHAHHSGKEVDGGAG